MPHCKVYNPYDGARNREPSTSTTTTSSIGRLMIQNRRLNVMSCYVAALQAPDRRHGREGDQRCEVTVRTSAAWRVHCVQQRSSRQKGLPLYQRRYAKECLRQGNPLRVTWKPLTDRLSVRVFRGAARGYIYIYIFFFTLLLSSFWTGRGHRCRPFSPPVLAFNFIAHEVQQSHCSSIFHRVLLIHALALSASQFAHKKKSQRIDTSMHFVGLELTKLTYTRLKDNLIRHRGDQIL